MNIDPRKASDVRRHDMFNIVALSVLSALDIKYLYEATDFTLIGSDKIGSQADFHPLFVVFITYMIVDSLWVLVVPTCTMATQTQILFHHLMTALCLLTPLYAPQFYWHVALGVTAEVNTLFLTIRRNATKDTYIFTLSNICFYITWICVRLVLFPMLCVFFYYEYLRYSRVVTSYVNVVGVAVVSQVVLTSLGYYWTLEMIGKMMGGNKGGNKTQ
ncbi:hypothetical protein EON65_31790 [archaeon]|nr:MAG: hypothetical protein EON65_31790 [archaeon]